VHAHDQEDVSRSSRGEANRDQEHDNCRAYVDSELLQRVNEATGAQYGETNALYDGGHALNRKHEKEQHKIEGGIVAECLVQWSIPTEEGARREKDQVKNAKTEDGPSIGTDDEERQAAQDVHEEDAKVEHPQIVRHLYNALEFDWNFHLKILVEAGLNGKPGR